MSVHLLVLIAAIVCMLFKAFGVKGNVDWFALGWAFALASLIV